MATSDDLKPFQMERAKKPKQPAPLTNKVTMKANYFEMRVNPTKRDLSQLHVDIEPEAQGKFRKRLFKWCKPLTEHMGVHVFDGYLLFSDRSEKELEQQWEGQMSHTYEVTTKREETYKIHVKYTGKLNVTDTRQEVVQLFNIILRRVYFDALKLVPMGRNFFDQGRAQTVSRHSLQVWPGYSSRIQFFQGGVMLNVDLVNKIVRTDTVAQQLRQLIRDPRRLQALVGSIVMTKYNNKTYRLEEVITDKNPETYTFDLKDGSKMSVMEYTIKKYNVEIKDLRQPLLRCSMKKQKGDIMLVPELCYMTGLSDEMRDNFRLMQDLAEFTKASPDARMKQLDEYRRRLDTDEVKKMFDAWDIEIKPSMVMLDGNVLPSQTIHLDTKSQPMGEKPDWTNFVRTDKLVQNVHLTKGSWVLVYKGSDESLARQFVSTLRRAASQMQIEIADPIAVSVPEDSPGAFIEAFRRELKPTMKLAAFIEPMKRKDLYDAVKLFLMNECPIPSQCLCAKTLAQDKRLLSVCLKVTLQIQAKMGGELWKVKIPLPNTMIVGIDVYHDTLRQGTSVVGFCATTNANFTKYFSIPVFQTSGTEIASELGPCMEQALEAYNKINGTLPARIIVYRDGVGRSQRDAVFEFEVSHMRRAFQKFSGYTPKMAVIIVEKAVNARFFTRQGGVLPGTVVDTKVVSKDDHDFYLVSQVVTQGTAAPTYYHVLCDDTEIPSQHLQLLSYALCHTYANWCGTVRVPAPCQYAHKLAYLIGQSIHRRPANNLADKLYYL